MHERANVMKQNRFWHDEQRQVRQWDPDKGKGKGKDKDKMHKEQKIKKDTAEGDE